MSRLGLSYSGSGTAFVYITINIVNSNYYIGITNGNKSGYLGSGNALKDAIKKYGRNCFKRVVLERCIDRGVVSVREKYWIRYFKKKWPSRKGLNLTEGGENDYTLNKESRVGISKKLKEYYRSNPHLKKKYQDHGRKTLGEYLKKYGPANRVITKADIDYINKEYGSYRKNLIDLSKELGVSISCIGKYVTLKKKCFGSGNGSAKLKEPNVIAIREMYASGKYLQREIAEKYDVAAGLVSRIVNRKIWTHI